MKNKSRKEIDKDLDAIFKKASPPIKFQSVGEKEKALKVFLGEYIHDLVKVEKNCFNCVNGNYNNNFHPCGTCNDAWSGWIERVY